MKALTSFLKRISFLFISFKQKNIKKYFLLLFILNVVFTLMVYVGLFSKFSSNYPKSFLIFSSLLLLVIFYFVCCLLKSLNRMADALKELNQLKSDFVSTVSHELRTPLTAIKGSIGLILGGVIGKVTQETEEMLKISYKNVDRLIRLISDILDVAKIEAGAISLNFQKHNIIDLIDYTVTPLQSLAQTDAIQLTWKKLERSPVVLLDRDRIEQVITNLISNAMKFTEPGGEIVVECNWDSEKVMIHVKDTGPGISEEFLDRIFGKFQQLEHGDKKAKPGTGLGLAIAKAIVEEHEGSIWVESKLDHGSCFSFSIPWNGKEWAES